MGIQEDLKALEADLAPRALAFLKKRGHVLTVDHIVLTVRVRPIVRLSGLVDSDWRKILHKSYGWTPQERTFLNLIKKGGNKPLPQPEEAEYQFANRIKTNFTQRRSPYRLSEKNGTYFVTKPEESSLYMRKPRRKS